MAEEPSPPRRRSAKRSVPAWPAADTSMSSGLRMWACAFPSKSEARRPFRSSIFAFHSSTVFELRTAFIISSRPEAECWSPTPTVSLAAAPATFAASAAFVAMRMAPLFNSEVTFLNCSLAADPPAANPAEINFLMPSPVVASAFLSSPATPRIWAASAMGRRMRAVSLTRNATKSRERLTMASTVPATAANARRKTSASFVATSLSPPIISATDWDIALQASLARSLMSPQLL
ncbi:hypothetical protein COSO111634_34110 [Corallococcus soli]